MIADRGYGFPPARGRQPSWLLASIIALFALAWLVLAWPWLSGAVTIPWDAKSQFFPQVQFLASALARGEAPFWTPNVYAGWPQISDPQSLIFSPLHLLLAALDPSPGFRAVDAVTFIHLFLGGIGVILFFHDRGWHPAGALTAAISFAFAGAASARLQHTGQVISLAYLPLALWLLARALERRSWAAGAFAGVVAGLMATGRDQVALLGLYVLAGFVVWHWFAGAEPGTRVRASIRPLAAAALACAIVACVPVIMTALLAARSNRPEFGLIDAGRGSLHPAHLLTLVFADLFGAADPDVAYWGPPSLPWSEAFGWPELYLAQNMGQVYCGALVIVAFIGLGLVRGVAWSRDIRFFTGAAIVILLYALGWYTPAFRLMYELLPGVSLFRRPADATFLLGALLAIVAGYLVHRWLDGTVPSRPWHRTLEAAIAAVLFAVAFALALAADRTQAAIVPVITATVFVIGAVAALAVARGLAETSALGATLLLGGLMVIDLAWNNAPNESTGLPPYMYDVLRPDTRDETVTLLRNRSVTDGARRDRVELTGVGYVWPNLSLVHGFEHLFGQNPLRLKWFYDATHAPDTVATPEQRVFSPLFPSYRSAMADLIGLRFIVSGVPVEQIDGALKPGDLTLVARTADAFVYENTRALPRVNLYTDWRIADFAELMATGWPDVDPRNIVLLERAPVGAPPPRTGAAAGSARIVRYANTEVVIAVDAPTGGILALNDVWHPWWRAEVDGTAAEVLRADAIFRAVVVPPGMHTVRFTFHPLAGAWAELVGKRKGRD